jgi:phosphohistidine phosphatase
MTDAPGTERTLVLLRHAKAEPPDDGTDADRPLTARGHADAAAAGAWLARHGVRPDVVLCSTARRTRQTWLGVATLLTGPAGPVVRYEPSAYEASPAGLLGLVRSVPPEAVTVLLVAHNPGISLLSALLDPQGAEQEGLRTSGLVVHRTRLPWAELRHAGIAARHTARA